MDADSIQILIMAVCVVFSAYFSATETAFSCMNTIRMKAEAEAGDKRAARALRLAENYDKLLSTILIGNNIVNILMASIATLFFVRHWDDLGATLSTVVTTVVVLIFGEISPKSIAKDSPEAFAKFSAPLLGLLMWVLTPVNFLFVQWKKLLSLIFKPKNQSGVTEQEILTMVEEATHGGEIDEQESELIRSAMGFNEQYVTEIFTPRIDVVGVPEEATYEEVAAIFTESGYSRLPVYRESMDDIMGVLHQRDFHALPADSTTFLAAVKPAQYITRFMKIGDLLRMLQKNKAHMAVVCDEFGGTMGIVTMEDILEELVGEIWDEHDEVIEDFVKLDDTTYRVQGGAPLDELLELLELEPTEEDEESSTVNGWAMALLDKIPEQGDTFVERNVKVTVEELDSKRIVSLLVTLLPPPEEEKEEE